MRGLLACLFVIVVAACATRPTAPFQRADCTSFGFEAGALDAGVDCGWVTVPERHARANRRELRIAVVRARAIESPQPEPILYLHGGPGIATLDGTPRRLRGRTWPLLRRTRNLVFFDQRGTGLSTPNLCASFNNAMDDLDREGLPPEEDLQQRLNAARTCRQELDAQGIDPTAYNSSEIAADAEAILRALGYERWNIFATSFGTLPAAAMVRDAPEHIRAVVLDSAFPPNSPNRAQQVSATAESLAAIQRRCDEISGCHSRYGDIRALAARTMARLQQSPLTREGGVIDGEDFRGALWNAQVTTDTVKYIPELLLRTSHGDDAVVRAFVSAFGNNDVFGGYAHTQAWLVNCHDAYALPVAAEVTRANEANRDIVIEETPADAVDRLCAALQPGAAEASFNQPLVTATPILIFFGEFDPATPRSDAEAALTGPSNATLVDVRAASHAPFYTDDCTRSIGAAFIAAPNAPLDTTCLSQRPAFAFADAVMLDEFLQELATP